MALNMHFLTDEYRNTKQSDSGCAYSMDVFRGKPQKVVLEQYYLDCRAHPAYNRSRRACSRAERGICRIMQWLQKFMSGRYGSDGLNLALIVLSFVLSIVISIFKLHIVFILLAYVPMVYALYRLFSRNTVARARENAAFMKVWRRISGFFQFLYLSARYASSKRYFLCPKCGRVACIPKGTGTVTITCKNCRHRYDGKA